MISYKPIPIPIICIGYISLADYRSNPKARDLKFENVNHELLKERKIWRKKKTWQASLQRFGLFCLVHRPPCLCSEQVYKLCMTLPHIKYKILIQ